MALDATECPIQKPSDYDIQKIFYSGKAGMHTIKYEIGTELQTGLFVWIFGGIPGSVHDLSMARISTILDQILPGEFILADKGYIGEDKFITALKQPKNGEEEQFNSIIYSKRIIVENSIGRIKFFNFTTREWRHDLELHALAMKALIRILNIDIQFRPLRK